LLIVVITGMTNPIPKASINVPNRTINIRTGIARRDFRGKRLQSMPTVPSFLAGAFIWLQNYPNLRNDRINGRINGNKQGNDRINGNKPHK
jgi:hypothetical protein